MNEPRVEINGKEIDIVPNTLHCQRLKTKVYNKGNIKTTIQDGQEILNWAKKNNIIDLKDFNLTLDGVTFHINRLVKEIDCYRFYHDGGFELFYGIVL